MKAQFLKIAGFPNTKKGVKDFYAKYTEESFMAKYGAKIKKFQWGGMAAMGGAQGAGGGSLGFDPNMVNGQSVAGPSSSAGGGGGFGGMMKGMDMVGNISKGIKALKAEKIKREKDDQTRQVLGKQEIALASNNNELQQLEVSDARQKAVVNPWDNTMTGEELFPIYGADTNILSAQRGASVKRNKTEPELSPWQKKGHWMNKGATKLEGLLDSKGLWTDKTVKYDWEGQPIHPDYKLGIKMFSSKNQINKTYDDWLKTNHPQYGIQELPSNEKVGVSQAIRNDAEYEKYRSKRNDDGMKEYKQGGTMKAQGGASSIGGKAFGDISNQAISSYAGNSGGRQIGGAIGGAFGPGWQIAGEILGDAVLSAGNRRKSMNYMDQSKASVNNMMGMNAGSYFQNQFNLEDGGTIKHADGGNIQMLEGSLTPISDNPNSGAMYGMNSKPHSEGGSEAIINGEHIEVEKEPIYENSEGDKVVAGDLVIPDHIKKSAEAFSGAKFPGKKYKYATASLGKVENKQNKIKDLNIGKADKYTPLRPLDRISLNTLKTNVDIADVNLEKLQVIKDGWAITQESQNEKEGNARYGKRFKGTKKFAQDGTTVEQSVADENVASGKWELVSPGKYKDPGFPEKTFTTTTLVEEGQPGSTSKSVKQAPVTKKKATNMDEYLRDMSNTEEYQGVSGEEMAKNKYFKPEFVEQWNKLTGWKEQTTPATDDVYEDETEIIPGEDDKYFNVNKGDGKTDPKKKGKFPWGIVNQIPQLFQDSDAEDFDNRALFPEISALVDNKLEAVQSQKYQPRLRVPYDISHQDSRNDIVSQSRAIERIQANNPQAMGASRAETYTALNKNRGEEFRQNQAFKDQVYSGNLQTLNDSDLKNLAIADTQYVRQSQAKSNTKATRQSAFNSMSDKISKHALENKTLRVWENMYDYRYDKGYKAHYQGPAASFENWKAYNDSLGGREPTKESYEEYKYNQAGKRTQKNTKKYSTQGTDWNGSLSKNGMLVKSYKKFK